MRPRPKTRTTRARAPGPSSRRPIPWESLLAERTRTETFARAQALGRDPARADAIDLASQQPSADLIPHAALRRCVEHVLRGPVARGLGYSQGQGLPRLRAAIARDLVANGIPATADDVVVTSGSQQAIDLVARALVDPGDAFLVEPSTYPGALHLFAAAGASLAAVPRDDDGPRVPDLRRLAARRPKGLYLMPNYHNPMGVSISLGRREDLVRWSHDARVPLVEDDYDAGLSLDGREMSPRLRALDADVLHLGTYSKKLIPALRIGYLLCPPALRAQVVALKTAQDNGTSDLLQHALAEFLDRGYLDAHLERVVKAYRVRRDALGDALREHLPRDVAWERPDRGLFLWIRLPTGLSSEAVYDEARRRGVLVLPSALFATSSGEAPGVRITYCREGPERLREGARRLAASIRAVARGSIGKKGRSTRKKRAS